ncbi:Protocatechuate 3,4-dioxygenase beta subunit [Paenibacillus algorifonticola]|uniref:Protocatechuate 3,4-dioxygenase beta subunit n=1 Tax=Paenibacillus algorifonticola TaxID=684063 RepID=A0A1I2GBR0_9BACL|nr:hypothetical protein [Paenibacillus algorifonticola]SFF14559.1 Protocatechuate 3,4-dioxygenase beta subunit [Paenibacillus algorifonticola]
MKKTNLWTLLILAALLLSSGCSTENAPKTPESSGSASNTAAETSTPAGSESTDAADDSGLTEQVTQGPYYITGTNVLENGVLNYDNLEGEQIKVNGYVYAGATGTTPVVGAKIEIWQADNGGNYHPNSNGAASSYNASELSLRGFVTTDEDGYYEYMTIYPGEYTGRTRHIHTNTTADGYTGVITQLIIPSLSGDQMTADEDNIAQSLPAYNQVTFHEIDGLRATNFNYRLAAQ